MQVTENAGITKWGPAAADQAAEHMFPTERSDMQADRARMLLWVVSFETMSQLVTLLATVNYLG